MKTSFIRIQRFTAVALTAWSLIISSIAPAAGARPSTASTRARRAADSAEKLQASLDPATKDKVIENYGKLPLSFEPNQGQADPSVKFLSRGAGYTLFLTATEAMLALRSADAAAPSHGQLKLTLVGANATPQVTAQERLEGKNNYLIGNDQSKWHTDIPTYGKALYREVWPGVDMVWYGNQRTLEYDFIVKPNVDPKRIKMVFEGADSLRLDAAGNLVLTTKAGEVTQKAPVIYQDGEQGRKYIAGKYLLSGAREVAFQVGAYDSSRPLVIDPQLLFATYAGGNLADEGNGVATDGDGNVYIIGATLSTNLPVKNALQSSPKTDAEAFVLKLNAKGSDSVYCTYLGSRNDDVGEDIAITKSGQACLTGFTFTRGIGDFPITESAFQGNGSFASCTIGLCRARDAFVTVLNAAGNGLVYSSYYGGGNTDEGQAIAVDNANRIFVAGVTISTNLPTKNGFQNSLAELPFADSFIAVFDPARSGNDSLLYASYLGGSDVECAGGLGLKADVATDNAGNAYLAGSTFSSDLPAKSPAGQSLPPLQLDRGSVDGFVAKIDTEASGDSSLTYLTYFGGDGVDTINSIAVDAQQRVYITGNTDSKESTFPLKNAFRATAIEDEAFVAKLNADGTAVFYCTYLGGDAGETGTGVTIDQAGNTYITGVTDSGASFLSVNPFPESLLGDSFVAKIEATVSATTTPKLLYSTRFGGTGTFANNIALDSSGNVFLTGITSSRLPATAGAFQSAFQGGDFDGFVAKIGPTFPNTIGVFRPSLTDFFLRNSNSAGATDITINLPFISDAIPVAGDWDGNGVDEIGIFRPSAGQFLLVHRPPVLGCGLPQCQAITSTLVFGQAGDLPVVGDWNGDGVDTVGVFRNGLWLLSNSPNINGSTPQVDVAQFNFGSPGDRPIAGDWDDNGLDTIGVLQNGQFVITNRLQNFDPNEAVFFILQGASGLPVAGDWDGDGVDTAGFFDNGNFHLRNSNTTGPADLTFSFGRGGDLPVAGDWNGSPGA
jgi:hypothetical protein